MSKLSPNKHKKAFRLSFILGFSLEFSFPPHIVISEKGHQETKVNAFKEQIYSLN